MPSHCWCCFLIEKASYKIITQSQSVFESKRISDIIGRSHKKIKVVLAPLSIYGFVLSTIYETQMPA